MKRKFNLELTILLVSFIISIVLFVLSANYRICLFFALFILGLTIAYFGYYRAKQMDLTLKRTFEEIDEIGEENINEAVLMEVYKEAGKLKKLKRKTQIMMYSCAILFIVCSFFVFI